MEHGMKNGLDPTDRLEKLKEKNAFVTLQRLDEIKEALELIGGATTQLSRTQWRALDRARLAVEWILE